MLRNIKFFNLVVPLFVYVFFSGCASTNPKQQMFPSASELIETLHHTRIENLYYETFPPNIKEMLVRNNIASDLIRAYDSGGDNLFRFNIIVILNNLSALSDPEKEAVIRFLERGLKDSSPWVRTEAVWGLGRIATNKSIPKIINLLDDEDANVLNETVLTLSKLSGKKDLPISNQNMSAKDREEIIRLWRNWWEE